MAGKIITFMFYFALVALCASVGSLFMPGEWYLALEKPSWNPPAFVFGPVWTALYLMMAVAAWLAWESAKPARGRAIAWWGVQLVLNACWSWLFFGLHRPGWALAEIVILLAAIVVTSHRFYRLRPIAGLLMIPYIGWVAFAAFLNFTLWRLNGGGWQSLF